MKRLLLSGNFRQMRLILLIFAMVTSLASTGQVTDVSVTADARYVVGKSDRSFFIENKGQWPNEVLFLTSIGGMDAWITKTGIVYDFYVIENVNNDRFEEEPNKRRDFTPNKCDNQNQSKLGQAIYMSMLGARAIHTPEGREICPAYFNYFIGSDSSKWASSVVTYKEVVVRSIYDKIDIRYYFERGNIRFDYIVQPGGDLSQIKFTIDGCEQPDVNEQGDLAFVTRFGEVTLTGLTTYQWINGKKRKLPSRFVMNDDGAFCFSVNGSFDRALPVFIDPLVYATFLGGTIMDEATSIINDSVGNAYVAGSTGSHDFPTTPGSYDHSGGYGILAFVSKMNPTGSELIYSTFIGGDDCNSHCSSIALDKQGNIYLTGDSDSSSFPTTPGSYTNNPKGMTDLFVAKLNAEGSDLLFSSRFGGTNDDISKSIALDTSGNTYITGTTYSNDLPTSILGFDTSGNGSSEAFIIKLNEFGSAILYSSYIGGSGNDYGYSIAIDKTNNAYITGWTLSDDFPVIQGSLDLIYSYDSDIFISKLNASGDSLLYSTFIGDSSADCSFSIAVDDFNNAYITGSTYCSAQITSYPTTSGSYDESRNGAQDIIVTKLNANGNALLYSTLIGGIGDDYGMSICLDNSCNAYITGWTESSDFPTTIGSYAQTLNGSRDAFVTRLSFDGDSLSYSSYLGGGKSEDGFDICIDDFNFAYITGRTRSINFPTTSGCFDPTFGGIFEMAFVAKISLNPFSNSLEPVSFSEIDIYPNPSDNIVNITFALPFTGILDIIDITGKVIYTKNIEDKLNEHFSVKEFSRGVFMVSIRNSAGVCLRQKLVVQ